MTYKDLKQFAIDNKITCGYCKHIEALYPNTLSLNKDELWCPLYPELPLGKKDFPCYRFERTTDEK